MGEISLDHSSWNTVVTSAESRTASISTGSKITLSKNTLSSFKGLFTMQESVISEVTTYKAANITYTQKMHSVAQKIVEEDNQAARTFSNHLNLAEVRFN